MSRHLRPERCGLVGLLIVATTVAAACGGPSGNGALPTTVHLTAADAGRTVALAVGGHLEVVLDSTYWTFLPLPPGGILRSDGPPQVVPRPGHCVPGQGCGTVTIEVTATAPGTAAVSATRTTCGEALRCGPGQGAFRALVTVRAPTL